MVTDKWTLFHLKVLQTIIKKFKMETYANVFNFYLNTFSFKNITPLLNKGTIKM